MEVSRSGYYKWIKRKGWLNQYEIDRKDLTALLIEMHEKQFTWGYRHLADQIRKEIGWIFSDLLAHKCCRDVEIRSKARIHYNKGIKYDWNIYLNLFNNEIISYDLRINKSGNGAKNH